MYPLKNDIDKLMEKLTHDEYHPEIKEIADDYVAKTEKINGASYNDLREEKR